jgi:hypothetical protein
VLGSLLGAVSSLDASRAARRFRRALIDYAFAGVAFIIGLGFLVAAAFIWAADRYGSMTAALGFGGAFIALSAVIMMVHRIVVARRARRRREEERADQLRSIVTAAAVAAVPALVRQAGLFGSLLLPLAAAAAYAIYRENSPRDPEDEPPQ